MHVQLGNILADLGELEAAERELGRATELDTRNVDALCDLAYILRRMDRFDEAERTYWRAID